MNFPPAAPGIVYIVGGGPGDPGLLTLKGAHLVSEADVILFDDLLDRRLLGLARGDCEQVYVGHRGGGSSGGGRKQEEVNGLLIQLARAGRRVVRLKGGDPYIFGRGGEEAVALAEAGVPFEVVSGVSAASGVPAYAGIPLTHRNVSAAAVLVTGHEDPARGAPGVDWELLARLDSTLVVFMGSRKLGEIAATLTRHGRSPETPAAAIERGTWPHQRTVVSTLGQVADAARDAALESPTLVLVGEVVALREQLNWFEGKPLFGRRILVTRSREQAGHLQLMLEAEGAEVSALPLLEIGPPADWGDLDDALGRLPEFTWILFTSPNSVSYFFDRLAALGKDARALGGCSIAAVGMSTAQHLRRRGLVPDLVPREQSQKGLATAFEEVAVAGASFLVPASSIGRTGLDEALARRGGRVHRVVAYENRPPDPETVELPAALVENRLDMIVFASPSSVRNFLTVCGHEKGKEHLAAAALACIGPTTAQAVRDLGFEAALQPAESSIPTLVQAICAHYAGERP